MDLENVLYVFSTQRLVIDFYSKQPQGLMPKALSISEFFKKSYIVPNKTRISHTIQSIILQDILREIIEKKPNITNLFVFEKSFLGYLEGSDFLLHLFNEIKSHNINFDDIPNIDIYADFTEHLAIIEEIFTRFENVLEKEQFFSLPHKDEITIISQFVHSFQKIEFFLDGFLTPLEVHILQQIAFLVPVHIHLQLDNYNIRHFPYLNEMLDSSQDVNSTKSKLESNFAYIIEMRSSQMQKNTQSNLVQQTQATTAQITTQKTTIDSSKNITCAIISKKPLKSLQPICAYSFEQRIGQCAFVLEKVRELLSSGVDGEQIAIVVPDEGIIEFFELLDEARNLNYAMGRDIKQFGFFAKLESLLNATDSTKMQNQAQNDNLAKLQSIIESSDVCANLPQRLASDLQKIFLEYDKIKSYINSLSWQDLVVLFLEELKNLRLDDVRGGKVRVMGILETRGLSFEYVFVLDCNVGFIPKVKDSDMFLNTFMRTQLAMPTLKDREHLQKHYYYGLFLQTQKQIFLTHTQNDESTRASLLDELDITSHNGDELYALFPAQKLPTYVDENIVFSNVDCVKNATNEPTNTTSNNASNIVGSLRGFRFSSSSLWTFFQCKRKFYFQYILKIAPQEEENLLLKMGINLHNILFEVFNSRKNAPLSAEIIEEIKHDFTQKSTQLLQNTDKHSYMERFGYEMNALEMGGFWQREKARALESKDNGQAINALRVLACEQEIESSIWHNGNEFNLTGRIDRIDIDALGQIWILDYKYSKNKKITAQYDFQLGFYTMLLESKIAQGHSFLEQMDSNLANYYPKDSKLTPKIQAGLYFLREKNPQEALLSLNEKKSQKVRESILQTLQDSIGQDNIEEKQPKQANFETIDFSLTTKIGICRNCPYIWLCNRA